MPEKCAIQTEAPLVGANLPKHFCSGFESRYTCSGRLVANPSITKNGAIA
jgi:hypothetical protein